VIYFRVTPKTKIDFVKNRFCVKIKKLPVFLNFFVFPGTLENYREFQPPEFTNYIHFPVKQVLYHTVEKLKRVLLLQNMMTDTKKHTSL